MHKCYKCKKEMDIAQVIAGVSANCAIADAGACLFARCEGEDAMFVMDNGTASMLANALDVEAEIMMHQVIVCYACVLEEVDDQKLQLTMKE